MRLLPFLLLAACPVPEKTEDSDSGAGDDDTQIRGEDGDADADWYGGCEYVATALGADDYLASIGGTPNDFATALSGARSSTFHWDETGEDTPFDHVLTIDASGAQLWVGEWREGGGDTGAYGGGGGREDEGGSEGGDDEAEAPGDDDAPEGETGSIDPDTGGGSTGGGGTGDTGTRDTGGGGWDTGGDDGGESCPDYITLAAEWTLDTGDGHLAEVLQVELRASSLTSARIDQELDYAELSGDWVPADIVPAEWDQVTVAFAANIGIESDAGEMALYASRTVSDGDTGDGVSMGEAMMGDVGRWPAP